MIVDTDIHNVIDRQRILEVMDEPWRGRFERRGPAPGHMGYWNPNPIHRPDAVRSDGSRAEASVEGIIEQWLDPQKIDLGVLNPAMSLGPCTSPEPDYANAVCRAINDVMLEDWLGRTERLKASITINASDPPAAADEIHRCAEANDDYVQVYMAAASRVAYGQAFYDPIYKAATAHDLPVGIHPGWEGCGTSFPPSGAGYPSSYFEWHTVLACPYIGHFVSLITEGAFARHPKLKFVLIEGGVGWVPPILWRFDKNWKALRVTRPWVDRPPSAIAADHIRLTTQPVEEAPQREQLHQLLAMFPAERMVMFSSDYPHWDGDTPDFVRRLLPEHLRGPIMAGVALDLYHLPTPVTS